MSCKLIEGNIAIICEFKKTIAIYGLDKKSHILNTKNLLH